MFIDIRNEFGKTFIYFLQIKRYLRLSKNSAVVNYVTLYVLFV